MHTLKVQPEGSIVAYSTAPGTIAYDGEGRNSPYVAELSKHMLTPGLKIEDVFKRVRIGVKNRTSRKPSPQIPWENSSMTGDFYFVYAGGEPTPQPSYTEISADKQMWELIEFSKDPTEFESFLREFPNSQFVPIARLKLKRLKGSQESKQASWIKDPSTGLNWENISSGKKFTWAGAIWFCKDLILGGGPYWRLPNTGELKSLGNSNIKESLKITSRYWTREDNGHIRDSALFYDSDKNRSWSNPQSNYYRVICVNGP